MKPITLTKTETRSLGLLALFGALIPNGVFCYYFFTSPETTKAALTNPISVVFIGEAFLLMFLMAWFLSQKVTSPKVSGKKFILMSLLGSMVFSVPAALYIMLGNRAENRDEGA